MGASPWSRSGCCTKKATSSSRSTRMAGSRSETRSTISTPSRCVRSTMSTVKLPTGTVFIKLWCINVGRVKLYLLDTNITENDHAEHRDITAQLYGGDTITRIRQE